MNRFASATCQGTGATAPRTMRTPLTVFPLTRAAAAQLSERPVQIASLADLEIGAPESIDNRDFDPHDQIGRLEGVVDSRDLPKPARITLATVSLSIRPLRRTAMRASSAAGQAEDRKR